MTRQDVIDIILVVAWTYGNGFLFAWLLVPLGLDPHKTGLCLRFDWLGSGNDGAYQSPAIRQISPGSGLNHLAAALAVLVRRDCVVVG